jgi:type VI secretion system protein VasD
MNGTTMHLTSLSRWLVCFAFCAVLGGCASSRNTDSVQLRTRLTASTDLNPDGSGRPSPVVVRVFELRTESEFNGAEFFALYEREKQALSATLVGSQELVLQPGETRQLYLTVPRETRYVGVVAAYRDIRGARWRAVARAPRKTWTDVFSRDVITIGAGRSGITLAIAD